MSISSSLIASFFSSGIYGEGGIGEETIFGSPNQSSVGGDVQPAALLQEQMGDTGNAEVCGIGGRED